MTMEQTVLFIAIAFQTLCTINAQISPYLYGHCDLGSTPSGRAASGQDLWGPIDFRQQLTGPTEVKFSIAGFRTDDPFRSHGFRIHEYGDVSQFTCDNSGAHYNPLGRQHGDISDGIFDKHLGDFGNFQEGSDGVTEGRFFDENIALHGDFNVLGRLISISFGPDDLGRIEDDEQSALDGNTNQEVNIGCCIIGTADNRAWLDD